MSLLVQSNSNNNRYLNKLFKTWFITVFIGQLLFAIYIFGQYFIKGVLGKLDDWVNSSSGGYVQGDVMGNSAFIAHVIIAGIVTLGGPLQLISSVRNRFPVFHKWNGRIYGVTGILTSIAGFYLTWVRGTVGDFQAHVMTSINGLLIIIAALYTIYFAMSGQISKHQRWALRLFLAMSGVFFFRVLLNFWLIASQGKGIDFDSFTGTPLDIIGLCSYIFPLLILEFYFRVIKSNNRAMRYTALGGMAILKLVFIVGTLGAGLLMWWPILTNYQ